MSRAKVELLQAGVAPVLGVVPSGRLLGYARVSTDGQSLAAQLDQLQAAGAARVFRETASGAKADRAQLAKFLREVEHGDVVLVTRLDRLARSTRDLLDGLAAAAERGAAVPGLGGPWTGATTAHGRLMLVVLAGCEREPIRACSGERAPLPRLDVARSLFGEWGVERQRGRIGGTGRSLTEWHVAPEAALGAMATMVGRRRRRGHRQPSAGKPPARVRWAWAKTPIDLGQAVGAQLSGWSGRSSDVRLGADRAAVGRREGGLPAATLRLRDRRPEHRAAHRAPGPSSRPARSRRSWTEPSESPRGSGPFKALAT